MPTDDRAGPDRGGFTRRAAIGSIAGAGLLGFRDPAWAMAAASASGMPAALAAKFADPDWKRRIFLRLEGDTKPGTQIHGFNTGMVFGVRDGERLKSLFGYDVFSSIRLLAKPGGVYERLCREVIFYRDLATGRLLDEWDNPYTGERVRVVDVANDPVNYRITPRGIETSKGPLQVDTANMHEQWLMLNENLVGFERDAHLFYPSMLTPEKWPRESPGKMTRASEFMRYVFRREDLENDSLTHVPHAGTWGRVNPWLPWMLMDQAPGHVLYMGMFSTRRDPSEYSPAVLARLKERYPKYLEAPEAWSEPSYSSLENYTFTQKPAPPRR